MLAQLRDVAEAAVAPHGATAQVTIGVDRFDAYTGTPVEAPQLRARLVHGRRRAGRPRGAGRGRRRARPLAVLHQRQRDGGARDPHDRLRAGRRDARPPRRRAHRARRAGGRRARLRRAGRGADGDERAAGRQPARRPGRARGRAAPTTSIARCPATRRRRSWTRRAAAEALGVARVWVKDESSRLGLPSFKILGASWAIHRALEARGDRPRLACATDGNHGRAVARVARERGLEATVFVPADMIAARREAIAAEGARVEVVDGSYDEAVERRGRGRSARDPGHRGPTRCRAGSSRATGRSAPRSTSSPTWWRCRSASARSRPPWSAASPAPASSASSR